MLLAAAVCIAQAAALHAELRRYVVGTDTPSLNLDATIEWWWGVPWSPNVNWLLGTAAFSAAVVLLTAWYVRAERREDAALRSAEDAPTTPASAAPSSPAPSSPAASVSDRDMGADPVQPERVESPAAP